VSPAAPPPFAVISGSQVQQALQGSEKQIVELVEATYRLHGAGNSGGPAVLRLAASTLGVGQGARVGMAAGAALGAVHPAPASAVGQAAQ
jgi:hypothetical protein